MRGDVVSARSDETIDGLLDGEGDVRIMHRGAVCAHYALSVALSVAGCGGPTDVSVLHVSVLAPSQGRGPVVHFTEGPECPLPDEWELVTWPEMVPVSATLETPRSYYDWYCTMPITPDEPLAERWYAVRWRGLLTESQEAEGALLLRDGTRVFRVLGVTRALVTHVTTIPWEGRTFLRAEVSEPIEPALGYDWGSMMTATQGDVGCTYPGMVVTTGSGSTIGFTEALVVDCTGVDWATPLHVHIEGARTRLGSGRLVPVVDVSHTFGVSTDSVSLSIDRPVDEPLDVPPPAPPELCAESCE